MVKLFPKYILFFIAIFFSILSYAQNSATIKGKVTNSKGNGLENVFIEVNFSSGIFTDKNGEYLIKVPANKSLLVKFSYLENEKTKSFYLKQGETRYINISFNSELDGVTIIERKEEDIKFVPFPKPGTIPSPTGDFLANMGSSAIGVNQSNELSSSYSVRGGNYDENLIYVNDIEIYRPFLARSGQQEGLSFVNSAMVDNLAFSAGGFGARYGDKLSSVLDITYKQPSDTTISGSVIASLLGVFTHFEGMSKNKKFSHLTGVRYRSNGYLLNSLPTSGDYNPVFWDAQTLLRFDLGLRADLEFLSHVSSNKYRVIPQTRETAFGPINDALKFTVFFEGQEITQFLTGTGALSLNYKVAEDHDLKFITSIYRTVESERFDVLGEYWLDAVETDLGSDDFGETKFNKGIGSFINHARNELDATVANFYFKGDIQQNKNHHLRYGGKFQQEFINDKLSEWNLIDSAGFSVPQHPANEIQLQEVLKAKNNLNSWRISGYFQDDYTSKPKYKTKIFEDTLVENSLAVYKVNFGIRGAYWSYNNQPTISPRASFKFVPRWYYMRDTNIVRRDAEFGLSVGLYHQYPFYREMRRFDGTLNKNIKAQRALNIVASNYFTFDWWERPFKFVTEAYYKHLTNVITYELDNVRIRYYANNNSKGYATGLDAKLNGEFIEGIESWFKASLLFASEDILDDYYYNFFNASGDQITPYSQDQVATDSIRIEPGYIPRPTDQRFTFGMFFQDKMPKWPSYKVSLTAIFGTGLPFGPPGYERYKDILRTPAYRRVDIGFSKDLLKKDVSKRKPFAQNLQDAWISLEVFNLLNISNTVSYTWIKDVNGIQYAVPNYLTSRRLNLKFVCMF